jgi:phosphoenolpyruvate synthase/pyruvate phosphate dikinase
MSQRFLYLPTEISHFPTYEVGNYAKELSSLESLEIKLPKFTVIPVQSLKTIAQANNLQAKAYKLIQEIDYSSSESKNLAIIKLEKLIQKQKIPKKLAEVFLSAYHDYFKKSFVLIRNSNTLPFTDFVLDNIHGDTNFVDATLTTWAQLTTKKIQALQLGTSNIHDILFPSPLLIQEQIDKEISGVAYSFDLKSGSKSSATIFSTWGVYTQNQQDYDQYLVDVRTLNILSKQIRTKKYQFRRVLNKLRTDEVLVKHQDQETLNTSQLKKITQIVSKIKKQYLFQVAVFWGIEKNQIYVISVKEAEINLNRQQTYQSNIKIFTTSFDSEVDGTAVYNAGALISASGTHPNQVVKTKQRKYLEEAIARTLLKNTDKGNKPLIYRANNFTSKEFEQLKFASIYEVPEANPLLGFRGGLRYIAHPEAFHIELKSLIKILEKTHQPVALLLPFIRSPHELTQLSQIIKKQGLLNFTNFSIWFELSTPENILNLIEYPLHLVQGVVFNTQLISALATGYDLHNPDLSPHYPTNVHMLKTMVEQTIFTIKAKTKTISLDSQPKVYVDLTDFNPELLIELCDLEINGLIIKKKVTEQVKTCIMERQTKSII